MTTTNNDFLPSDYKAPPSNLRYMKFKDGDNTFRILSSPVLGWEYWNKQGDNNKPIRVPYTQEQYELASQEASKNSDPEDQEVKHFWAMEVWNYDTNRIEVLEITQK